MEKQHKLAKKLGEVLAFAEVGLELFERAQPALSDIFSDLRYGEIYAQLTVHQTYLEDRADASKAGRTRLKLRGMMENYIGDAWDDPVEVLEWLGFYLGAAGMHWSLIAGMASNPTLAEFAAKQASAFAHWLADANRRIEALGKQPIVGTLPIQIGV